MNFNEKLLNLRKNAGMSQDVLAEKLGVTRQAVSKWELGTAMPETENIIKISKIYDVEVDWLLNHKVLPETIYFEKKTIFNISWFIIYIIMTGILLGSLMFFAINIARGITYSIRPLSWLTVSEYFQTSAYYRGRRFLFKALFYGIIAKVSFEIMKFIRIKGE
ncbi:MAG: helix-turn-helix transcriptional regulator [Ruminococcaceae bacterium]|nr:helix-turn-helix transcriptional regulator [Oscillospiraceae bacterium]